MWNRTMWKTLRRGGATVVVALLALPSAVQALPVQYDVSFTTSGQSIWDTGTTFTLNKTEFLGVAWQNKSIGIDLIVGSDETTIPNPVWAAYQAALAVCRGLGSSASDCINGRTGQTPVVRLGSRPSVRSCGTFAVACKFARAGDLIRRAAYDVAFAACRATGVSSSVCRNGRRLIIPLAALGTSPPATLDIDTRTGVAVNGTTDGRIGLELGIDIDSGSVDATVSYQATLDIPDTAGMDKAVPINFNPNSALVGINTLDTSFANLELSVDAIMELSGSVTAEGCVIGAGCVVAGGPFNITESASILSFNEGGEGAVLLFGLPPSDFGFPDVVDGFPFSIDIAGLAELTLYLPQPNASGGLDPATQKLTATGQDDLVDLILDLDNIVATAAGVPGLFGSSFGIGPGSVFFDIINVTMGPTIDLVQDFELDPTLWVSLAFDTEVMIGGELLLELMSPWDLLPDIIFLADATTVTPTFFLEASLLNQTLLDFDLEFMIDLLQIGFNFPIIGGSTIGIGNVLDLAVDLFQSPNLFSNLFPLGGFNLAIGESFVIDFISGSTMPFSGATMSASNEVPEPGTIFLFITGLCGLFVLRLRQRRRDRNGDPVLLPAGAAPFSVA